MTIPQPSHCARVCPTKQSGRFCFSYDQGGLSDPLVPSALSAELDPYSLSVPEAKSPKTSLRLFSSDIPRKRPEVFTFFTFSPFYFSSRITPDYTRSCSIPSVSCASPCPPSRRSQGKSSCRRNAPDSCGPRSTSSSVPCPGAR